MDPWAGAQIKVANAERGRGYCPTFGLLARKICKAVFGGSSLRSKVVTGNRSPRSKPAFRSLVDREKERNSLESALAIPYGLNGGDRMNKFNPSSTSNVSRDEVLLRLLKRLVDTSRDPFLREIVNGRKCSLENDELIRALEKYIKAHAID